MKQPLVSISCITYNHAPYIRQCLDGFLMQKCDFDFEVLIHDDASTDGTADIIKEYQEKYPEVIKPIYQTENQYSKRVSISAIFNWPRTQGKYIAMCEGDDYWIDPLKLQKQVDFLEVNEEYGLVYTKARMFFQDKQCFREDTLGAQAAFKDLLISNSVPTLTTMFKTKLLRECLKELNNDFFSKFLIGDYLLWLSMAAKEKLYFIPQITAVYRRSPNSASQYGNEKKQLEFAIQAFEIANSFAKKYLPNNKEYNTFLIKRYWLLYKHSMTINCHFNKEVGKKLIGLDGKPKRMSMMLFLFEILKLKLAVIFILKIKHRLFRVLYN